MDIIATGLTRLDPELADWVHSQWTAFADKTGKEDLAALQPCLDSLPRVWAASEFIARACVSRPAFLIDLVASDDLFNAYPEGELIRRISVIDAETEADLMRELRTTRQRETVRIAWPDSSLCFIWHYKHVLTVYEVSKNIL